MKTDNRSLGNSFEDDFSRLLFDRGFWVKKLPQTQQGQPADVLAVKKHKAYLIDCKVCSGDGFPLDRIEPNQTTAMELWHDCGNGDGWFALLYGDGEITMISFTTLKAHRDDPERKSKTLSFEEIVRDGISLEKWLEKK